MKSRQDILNEIFNYTYDRLKLRKESLQFFVNRWNGSFGGIEGWFKVELVASIPDDLIKITTGSASRGKSTGKRYPDLRFEHKNIAPIDVELKASTNWSLTHGKTFQKYEDWALFFLCGTPSNSLNRKSQYLYDMNFPYKVNKVCEAKKNNNGKTIDFLFGYIDLGCNYQRKS